jgi:hypothetical protein
MSFPLAVALLLALFVASSAQGADHDGPGYGCVTHIGHTYVDLSSLIVHTEGSGGCNSSADRTHPHFIRHDLEIRRWWGWSGIQTNSRDNLYAPFAVWLPIQRAACPGTFRGHVYHKESHPFWGIIAANSRYTNQAGC